MNLIMIITYAVWCFSEILLNISMRSSKKDKQHADKNSLRLIWLGIILGISLAVFVSIRTNLPITFGSIAGYAGIGIILFGVVLRLSIIKSLGKFFTVDVTIRKDHQLKTDGFYKHLRHPSYAASLISFVGYGLSTNNWYSLLIITVLMMTVFIRRIKIEETALSEQFGTAYRDYKAHTKAIIPFIY